MIGLTGAIFVSAVSKGVSGRRPGSSNLGRGGAGAAKKGGGWFNPEVTVRAEIWEWGEDRSGAHRIIMDLAQRGGSRKGMESGRGIRGTRR